MKPPIRGTKKRLALQLQLHQQSNYLTHWPATSKLQTYDPLTDKYSQCYFELPTVQKHLRKLKRKVIKQQMSTSNDKLLTGIQRSSSVMRRKKTTELRKSYEEIRYNDGRYQRAGSQERMTENGKAWQFTEMLQRAQSRRNQSFSEGSPSRMRNDRYSRDQVMESVIRRRKGMPLLEY